MQKHLKSTLLAIIDSDDEPQITQDYNPQSWIVVGDTCRGDYAYIQFMSGFGGGVYSPNAIAKKAVESLGSVNT